jgi:hypothetical protein
MTPFKWPLLVSFSQPYYIRFSGRHYVSMKSKKVALLGLGGRHDAFLLSLFRAAGPAMGLSTFIVEFVRQICFEIGISFLPIYCDDLSADSLPSLKS